MAHVGREGRLSSTEAPGRFCSWCSALPGFRVASQQTEQVLGEETRHTESPDSVHWSRAGFISGPSLSCSASGEDRHGCLF